MTQKKFPKVWRGNAKGTGGIRLREAGISSFDGYLPGTERLQQGARGRLATVQHSQSPAYTTRNISELMARAGLRFRRKKF